MNATAQAPSKATPLSRSRLKKGAAASATASTTSPAAAAPSHPTSTGYSRADTKRPRRYPRVTKKRTGRLSEEPNEGWTEKDAYLEKERLDKVLYLLGSQLGPLLDRTGRLFMDVSPHLAMQGQNIKTNYAAYGVFDVHPLSVLSHAARNRVRSPEASPPDPIARFLDPLSYSRSMYPERNSLSSMGQNLSFQVPVMLSPGELLSTNSRNNSFIGERDVHLHINAQVHMPGTLASTAADHERHRRRERQEQQRHQTTQTAEMDAEPLSGDEGFDAELSECKERRGSEKRPSLRRTRRHLVRKPLRGTLTAGQAAPCRATRSKIRKNKEDSRNSKAARESEEDRASGEQH